eukprot:1530839-Prymnesium_polylepis.2
MKEQSVLLRLNEVEDEAEGRFVYIRSFGSSRMLRIDGAQFYTTRLRRRLKKPVVKETHRGRSRGASRAARGSQFPSKHDQTTLFKDRHAP